MNKKLYFEVKWWKIIPLFSKKDLVDWKYYMKQVENIRSLKSNRFYWWYFLKFIIMSYKDFWYIHTKDELHEIFKKAFAPRDRVYSHFSRKYVQLVWSTTNMTNKQFSEFMNCIWVIFEFGEMKKLWLEKIDSFVIPDINEEELLEREKYIC